MPYQFQVGDEVRLKDERNYQSKNHVGRTAEVGGFCKEKDRVCLKNPLGGFHFWPTTELELVRKAERKKLEVLPGGKVK